MCTWGSPWQRRERETFEIEVDTRPQLRATPPGSAPTRDSDAVRQRRTEGGLPTVAASFAWTIPAVGALGYVLTSFWTDDQGIPGLSMRRRIGGLFSFLWVPFALAALVYAFSFTLTLYTTRIQLEADHVGGPTDR